jgi:hypothetical protein
MLSDFKNIRFLTGGYRGLYLGLVPWTITEVIRGAGDFWVMNDNNQDLIKIKEGVK